MAKPIIHRLFPWLARGHETVRRVMGELDKIPLGDAVARVQVLMTDTEMFRVAQSSEPWAANVHPTVLRLFDGLEEIEPLCGELRLARAEVAETSYLPGWDRIGTDLEHTDIIVERSTGKTMQHDGDVHGNAAAIPYPSVFHFILSDDDELWARS